MLAGGVARHDSRGLAGGGSGAIGPRFPRDDDMLMYGCVVRSCVWEEEEGTVVASTSQRRPPFLPDGFLSVQNERVLGLDVPSHCRPASFICIQCRRHPRLRHPVSRLAPSIPPRAPTYHRNIVNMAAHRNYRTGSRGEASRARAARVGACGLLSNSFARAFCWLFLRPGTRSATDRPRSLSSFPVDAKRRLTGP